jgi:hypothetical protein
MDLEAIFQNEDLSGLVFESRSRRKRGFETIEDLLQEEFALADGLEASQAAHFASERSLFPGSLFQDAEYKMQLKQPAQTLEPAPAQPTTGCEGRPVAPDPGSVLAMSLEGRDSLQAHAPQSSSKPHGFQPKKKQRSKIEINQQVKKSLRKYESEKRQFNQQLQRLLRALSISGRATHFAFVSRNELQLTSSEESLTKVKVGSGSDLFARNNSRPASSSFNFRLGVARLEQACSQALRPVGRENFTDTQRFCKFDGPDSCVNVLSYFDEGVLLNIVLNRKVAAPDPVEILHFDTFCAGGLEPLGLFVAGEVRSMVSELKTSVFGVTHLHTLLDEVFQRIRSALVNKENLGLAAAPNAPEEDATTPKASKSPRVRSAPNSPMALLPSFYFP